MIEPLLRQLQSPDPAQRRQAIMGLANSKDPAALPALAKIYRQDPDQELRDLALKAGRYIRQHEKSSGAASAPNGDTGPAANPAQPSYTSEPVYYTADGNVAEDAAHPYDAGAPPAPDTTDPIEAWRNMEVRYNEAEMARKYMDRAADYHLQGDTARAIENLGKGLAMDPKWEKEQFARNLTMTLTGRGLNEMIPILINPDARNDFIGQLGVAPQKKKRTQQHGRGAEKATWDNVLVDAGIYWVMLSLVLIIGFVLLLDFMQDVVNDYNASPAGAADPTEQIDDLAGAGIVALLIITLFISTANLISLFISGWAIHFSATMILGGDGTLVYLYRRYFNYNTIITVLYAGGFIVLGLFGSPELFLIAVGFVGFFGSIAAVYWLSTIIAEVYNFGVASGCGAIIISGIVLAILQCGAQFFISTLISVVLEATM